MRLRFAWMLLLTACHCAAQWFDLATTRDGSALYFSSRHRERGTAVPQHEKLYRWTPSTGVRLFHWAELIAPSPDAPPTATLTSNAYQFFGQDVSSDGSVLLVNANYSCFRRCAFVDGRTSLVGAPSEIATAAAQTSFLGYTRLSANGRWVVGFPKPTVSQPPYIVDLADGRGVKQPLRGWSNLSSGNVVSDTGEALLMQPTRLTAHGQQMYSLLLWTAGETETLLHSSEEVIKEAIISPDGFRVAYTSRWSPPHSAHTRIRLLDRLDKSVRTLAEGTGDRWSPQFSNDGDRLLYLSAASGTTQPEIVDLTTNSVTSPPPLPEGATAAILSGDGNVVFATTFLGRLVRWERSSDAWTELIPRTISFTTTTDWVSMEHAAPGSLLRIRGAGFVQEPVVNTSQSTTLDGLSVSIGGTSLIPIAASPGEILALTPWGVPAVGPTLTVETTTANLLFEGPQFTIRQGAQAWPADEPDGVPSLALAIDGAFTRRISRDRPAELGEVIHIYASGLGPVVGAPPDGPAPVDPLPQTLSPLACEWFESSFSGRSGPVDVLYAGLAPGQWGLYQLTVRLPTDVPRDPRLPGLLSFRCRGNGADFGFYVLIKP